MQSSFRVKASRGLLHSLLRNLRAALRNNLNWFSLKSHCHTDCITTSCFLSHCLVLRCLFHFILFPQHWFLTPVFHSETCWNPTGEGKKAALTSSVVFQLSIFKHKRAKEIWFLSHFAVVLQIRSFCVCIQWYKLIFPHEAPQRVKDKPDLSCLL